MPILTKLYGWLAAAGLFVLSIAGALLYGRSKGRAVEKAAVIVDQAQQQVNTTTAILNRNEVRQHVDAQVAQLPASPVVAPSVTVPAPLPVPGSAADQLRQQWSVD
jgi:hypothetical protein